MPTRYNRWVFIADLIACSTCFGHDYAHHQELESIIQVVAVCRIWCLVLKLSVKCGAEGCVSGLRVAEATLSSTLYRQLENQAPNTTGRNHLYNTLELLMMGIMVPETCWTSNKICNKNSSFVSSWHFISTYSPYSFQILFLSLFSLSQLPPVPVTTSENYISSQKSHENDNK
jgi:hypothetical protein